MTIFRLSLLTAFTFAALMGMFIWGLEGAPRTCNAWDEALRFSAEQRHKLIGAWNQRAMLPPNAGLGDGPEIGAWKAEQERLGAQ